MESYIEDFKEERDKESDLVITVDGMAGAGKGTLAESIAEKLDLKHFSASDVWYDVAEERNLEDHELSEEAEKEVDLAIDRKTLERALNQNCVVEGRIPSWVLGSYSDFRIRLKADKEERAQRLAGREGIEEEGAEEIVEKRDREDSKRYKDYYGINTDNLEIYDLILDNTDLSIGEQKRLVAKALEQRFPERTE